jgi:hypothetical protein
MALIAVMALVIAACADADEPPDEPTDEPPEADAWASCTNDEDGWAAEYPSDWEVNPGDEVAPCSLFDPEPIDLHEGPTTIPLDIAVHLRAETIALDFEDIVEDRFAEQLDRMETIVDGHDAVRIEQEQTEDGIIPEGTRSVRYVVELDDDRALIAVSYDIGEPAFVTKVEVLDEMMERIELVDPEPVEGAWRIRPDAPRERINPRAT